MNRLELSPDSAMHRADIEAAVDDKLPYLLRFFGDDDDDVSVMVADFLIEHIAWMKSKNSSLTECQLAYCQVGTPVTSVGVVVIHQRRRRMVLRSASAVSR